MARRAPRLRVRRSRADSGRRDHCCDASASRTRNCRRVCSSNTSVSENASVETLARDRQDARELLEEILAARLGLARERLDLGCVDLQLIEVLAQLHRLVEERARRRGRRAPRAADRRRGCRPGTACDSAPSAGTERSPRCRRRAPVPPRNAGHRCSGDRRGAAAIDGRAGTRERCRPVRRWR